MSALEPGNLDGRVELRELLGEGGMGEVHAAWDRSLERPVAVKLLRGPDPRGAERLLLEARLQARVEHPHVVRVFEVGALAGRPCILFQLVRGRTLADLAAALPVADRVELARQAATGLHAAHQQGLVHRDVKPGNVLVEEGEDGSRTALVTDFGLAHAEEGGLTRPGLLPGTLDFMAPEQLAGGGPVDFRSDVYSLGATLYAVLAGRPPFRIPSAKPDQDADEQLKVLRRILEEEAPPLARVAPGLPRELSLVCGKAMEREPGARYPSAQAFADDLSRFQRGEPVLARPAGLVERASKWTRRNPAASRALAAALGVLLLAGGVLLAQARRAGQEALEAARLGAAASSLESRMRMEYLSPPHDLRPALAEVRREVEQLRPLAARPGGGPASFALGKGLELLGDLDGARAAYERSWSLGFRTPQAAEGLGTALAGVYQREYARAQEALPPRQRADRLRELQASLRDPARGFLEQGDARGWRGPFLRGRVALLEGAFGAARQRAADVLAADPGRYEARLLEGEAWFLEGKELLDGQKNDEAAQAFDRSAAALEAGLEAGRSDPSISTLLAVDHSYVALSQMRRGQDPAARADRALAWAARARALQSDSATLAMAEGRSIEAKAMYSEYARPADLMPLLEQASVPFRRATALEPGWYKPLCTLAFNLYCRAVTLLNLNREAGAEIEEGLRTIASAEALAPKVDEVLFLSMLLQEQKARALQLKGDDPTELLRSAIARGDELLHIEGIPLVQPRLVQGRLHLTLAVVDWGSGRDPRANLDRAAEHMELAAGEKRGQPEAIAVLAEMIPSMAALRVAVGDDVRPLLARGLSAAEEVAREHPELDSMRVKWAALLLAEARRRAGKGEDPAALAERAAALLASAPRFSDTGELESLQAQAALQAAEAAVERGRPAGARLAEAERRFRARLAGDPGEGHSGLAACALLRARSLPARGAAAREAARRGLTHAGQAIARDPRSPELRIRQARLQAWAGDVAGARASLDRAYAMQPLVKGSREAGAAEAELAAAGR